MLKLNPLALFPMIVVDSIQFNSARTVNVTTSLPSSCLRRATRLLVCN